MKKYRYEDGFTRIIEDGYITPKQMHNDEKIHGELICMNDLDNSQNVPTSLTREGMAKRGK